MSDSIGASRGVVDPPNQTVYLLEQELAQTRWFAGHCRICIHRNPQPVALQWRAPRLGVSLVPPANRRNDMHPEDLMKPDLFSEILLLGGAAIFAVLLLVVVTALARA